MPPAIWVSENEFASLTASFINYTSLLFVHMSPALSKLFLLVAVLWSESFSSFPEPCLDDPDYDELVKTAENGLGKAAHPVKVVIVGAGISGLTAAKLLRDAGHMFWKPVIVWEDESGPIAMRHTIVNGTTSVYIKIRIKICHIPTALITLVGIRKDQ
ncbi:hypothetical protein KIL84_004911 [Mauremys mutica]|uniref:Uncharacterized protein n=1 Tax=Mauremys mutica TaxID=74926 RepID=A0A9D4B7X5_9SAUR|nr:hypothetical protein KIL84_004911 [Mauremys mutica]